MIMLPWVVSAVTIISTELTIRKLWWGWALSSFSQGLWLVFIVETEQWGLLLLNVYMIVQSGRGTIRWRRESKEKR